MLTRFKRHITRHVVPPKRVSQRKLNFEHKRPRVLRECMAEATGVFFYVLPGIASVCTFTLNGASPLGVTAFGSIFQIGWVSIPGYHTHLNIAKLEIGFRHWYRICHHHLCPNVRWPLQPCHYNLLRDLARFPMEESPTLYLLTDFWGFHGRPPADWHVLAGAPDRRSS
jgi:hypothetical protein